MLQKHHLQLHIVLPKDLFFLPGYNYNLQLHMNYSHTNYNVILSWTRVLKIEGTPMGALVRGGGGAVRTMGPGG